MKKLLTFLLLLILAGMAFYWFNRPKPIEVSLTTVETGVVEQLAANSRAGTVRAWSPLPPVDASGWSRRAPFG